MTGSRRLEASVHGRVQGVGFRWFVRRSAVELRLTGWVANDPSGSVRVVAEGAADALDELVNRLARGPGGASVERVDRQLVDATDEFASFDIRGRGHSGD